MKMGLRKVVLMNSRSRMPVQMDAFLGAFCFFPWITHPQHEISRTSNHGPILIFFLESRVTEHEHIETVPTQSMLSLHEGK